MDASSSSSSSSSSNNIQDKCLIITDIYGVRDKAKEENLLPFPRTDWISFFLCFFPSFLFFFFYNSRFLSLFLMYISTRIPDRIPFCSTRPPSPLHPLSLTLTRGRIARQVFVPKHLSCFVWKLSCITSHSLIHAYMYTNDACNFIFTHQ